MIHTFSAGGVVLNKKGEVAVVSQPNDTWSLPKGHIDLGEDELTAACREILEESGISDLTLVCKLGSYDRYRIGLNGGDDFSELKNIAMFLFTTKQEELKPQDPRNPEARWVDKNEVANLLTHSKDKEFFESIINKI